MTPTEAPTPLLSPIWKPADMDVERGHMEGKFIGNGKNEGLSGSLSADPGTVLAITNQV